MKLLRNEKGLLKLMELIIVMLVILILARITVPSYFNWLGKMRVRTAIRDLMIFKKGINDLETSCQGLPIRDRATYSDAASFLKIIDKVECVEGGESERSSQMQAFPSGQPCNKSLGEMLGVESIHGHNELCVPASQAIGTKWEPKTGFQTSDHFVTVFGDPCTPSYAGVPYQGGSPGWNYVLLSPDMSNADAMAIPAVGVLCGIAMGARTPVKIIINTKGIYNGNQIKDGTGMVGLLGNFLGSSGCACGPYCEEMNTGRKGCCAPCQGDMGLGYKY